jgi:flagellar biogenesis protein FliO
MNLAASQELVRQAVIQQETGLPGTETVVAIAGASFWVEWLRMLGILVSLGALLLITLHVAKRYWKKPQGLPLIRVLGRYYLASRQALLVVAVDHQRFLLASNQDRVDFLTSLSDPPVPPPDSAQEET